MLLEHICLNSSTVATIKFDDEKKIIYVNFAKTGTYQYYDCLMAEYQELINAPSAGKAIHTILKGKEFKKGL